MSEWMAKIQQYIATSLLNEHEHVKQSSSTQQASISLNMVDARQWSVGTAVFEVPHTDPSLH